MAEFNTFKLLMQWMVKHNARALWQQKLSGFDIEAWRVNGQLVLVQVFYREGTPCGWDLYTSVAPDTNDIERTLAEAEQRLGLK